MDSDDDSMLRLVETFFDDDENDVAAVADSATTTTTPSHPRDDDASVLDERPSKKRTVSAGYKLLHPPLVSVTRDMFSYDATATTDDDRHVLDLPDALLGHCASFLSASDVLLTFAPVNQRLWNISSHDGAGWKDRVQQLRERYQFVSVRPPPTTTLTQNTWVSTFYDSLTDVRQRNYIHMHELCYDVSGTVFQFRFKAAAGQSWTENDPWFTTRKAKRVVFLRGGDCRELMEDGSLGENQTHSWRWIARPMDLPRRPQNTGHYVRLTIEGRDVPTYSVRRSETGNGGFVLESCWGMFSSFEMTDELRERITNEIQWREAFLYNVGSRMLPEGEEATEQFDRAWRG